ncbi:hypothetical protein BV25DRAFT_1828939 [Artomyces pyxidatus]|uniref:Uncharacterized protein n=1 Tax=Artomyces pyxidatus TaxID=48021 RepID=A0ACB8SUS4_9AGAM|nr:hypothetical protein BV25DRAFT_1828939 [Artomyces pyxidatus]
MHSTSNTSSAPSASSGTASPRHHTHPHPAVPVPSRSTAGDQDACVDYSAPQCCHCGWRGSHSPNCPFRRH